MILKLSSKTVTVNHNNKQMAKSKFISPNTDSKSQQQQANQVHL